MTVRSSPLYSALMLTTPTPLNRAQSAAYRSLTREVSTYVLAIELRQSNTNSTFNQSILTAVELLEIEDQHAEYVERIVGSTILQLLDRKRIKL